MLVCLYLLELKPGVHSSYLGNIMIANIAMIKVNVQLELKTNIVKNTFLSSHTLKCFAI